MKNAIIAALALTLAACGGPLFGGEVEAQRICITKPNVQIQGLCSQVDLSAAAGLVSCTTDPATALADTRIPPAVRNAIASLPPQASHDGTFPLRDNVPALDKKGTTGSLKLTAFKLKAGDAVLGALTDFDLELKAPTEAAPFLKLTYVKGADSYQCDAASGKCSMTMTVDTSTTNAELFDRLKTADVDYHVSVKGNGTEALTALWKDWNADLETCMSAKLTIDALEAMKN